jgi:hypothetical protein
VFASVLTLTSWPALAHAADEPGTAAPELVTTFRAAPRARTMEELADASTQELHMGGFRSRYSLNFFGDTSFALGSPEAPANFPSFSLGPQDFLLKGELGGHIVATTEFAFEAGDEGAVLDVERLHVRWETGPFYVEAGRVHTDFGYWNNAYHHGRWLQPTIERPRWVAFEDDDGILPVHWVGLNVGAKLPVATGVLRLTASVGNGRGKIVDDVRSARDYQAMKALHAAVEFVGLYWPDLRIGISGIYDRIPAQPAMVRPMLPDVSIQELIGGAHVAYVSVPLVFIAEGYVVDHRQGGHTWTTLGGFGLLGYSVGVVTPYLRVERVGSRGGMDPFFMPDPAMPMASFDTVEGIAGLRLDVSDWSALKAEYRLTRILDRDATTHQGVLNWSWGF